LVGAGQGARYTAAVSDFLGAPREGHVQGATMGRYLITGTVRDAHGQPIEGAPVQVGRLVYYTDASGRFQARSQERQTATCRSSAIGVLRRRGSGG
jgi:protocatechuate 3,4-dioxygenase beta subunit